MFDGLKRALRAGYARLTGRLANKLILFFSTIIILVVVSLTLISGHMLRKESVANSIESTENNLKLVNQNLEDYLADIEQLSLPQIRYDELIQAIINEDEDYASKMYLDQYLRSLFYSRSDLNGIFLYLIDQEKYYSITREGSDTKARVGFQTGIADQPWFEQAMTSPRSRSFQSFAQSNDQIGYTALKNPGIMAYHRVIRSIASREPRAVISFYIQPEVIEEILQDIPMEQGEHLIFLDPDNTPFYADDLSFFEQMKDTSQWGYLDASGSDTGPVIRRTPEGSQYLIVSNTGETEKWKLAKPIPYSNIYEPARQARNVSFLIGAAFLILSIVLIAWIANAITRPLYRLSRQMRKFSEGTFDAVALVRGQDEIADLNRHFNKMVFRTNELINERYKMKLVEKNAILKALEAEINPHFLYNALQAISTKALRSKDFEVADMIGALALTLRYCIGGKDIVLAREELQHIDRYLALQKARFGDRLEVELEWDESLKSLQIPKLSLQTLIENSIKHAVEKVSGTVKLRISAAFAEGHFVITVEDNGPGIPQKRIDQLEALFQKDWEETQESENIGLKNLNTRLKLLYGEHAELRISNTDHGVSITMMIPRGEDSDVQSIDY
ncbi:sensor histidine kinase YesM [Paenibacillus antibioticophila]|uniref:Sensor histidine kinase YesM n=1 Tax=Paenibacillus antibioticophila TaxID=1274374 RepID=A0A919XLV3_9BACL|nr:sensor histidine kinase [Paenibacillus antibioticophila]GIO35387.1 sensor histidine kinase YesM [Paenibacillus antibioticophila]